MLGLDRFYDALLEGTASMVDPIFGRTCVRSFDNTPVFPLPVRAAGTARLYRAVSTPAPP
eukprot:13113-Eustigmatos_ZCMA.PRE.1